MNCNNCTNNNALKEVKIKHVHGNLLRMAIPLTLRSIELVDGEINATDTPFVPSSEHPVKVVFSKGSVSVALDATMKDGNIAYIEEKGKIPVGTYAITVTCNDDNGNPYRFKQNAVLYVADATIEAGIEETIEYEVTTWYLDAAIFLALKGDDGVGIDDIETQSSGEIGGVNTVTFILTDGRTRSFTILNGSGAVDSDLDIDSPSPIANSAVTAKFNELSGELADLFGDVDYDSSAKSIRFWDKGKTNVLASLDARPFIKDGMVSNAYISNNTLVITFNTDSGKEAIGVPLTTVFNPNNYYTKTQVDSRIASAVANINLSNYYTKAQTDAKLSQKVNLDATTGRVDASQATRVVLDYIVGIYDGEDEPSHDVNAGDVWYDNGQIHYAYNNDVIVVIVSLGAPQKGIIYCNAENNKTYRWTGSEFVQVGGGNSEGGYEPPVGGIPKSDLAQSVQDTLDDVSNKVDKVSGKGLSTEDYTTAEKQKLDGLSNYDDTEIQAEVDAKYEKPSTGIPKSDLASDVQASLGKADTALQSHQSLADVFAIVDYDSTTKHINFYGNGDTNKTTIIGYVDATNFIKDGMVSNVDITNGNLVVTFNTDSGKEPISIALTNIFNPSNYYTKTDIDNKGYLTTETDPSVPAWAKAQNKPSYTASEVGAVPTTRKVNNKALSADITLTASDVGAVSSTGYVATDNNFTTTLKDKLDGIAAGAEVNVQADWNETNTSSDAYIANKPTIPAAQVQTDWNASSGMGVILNKPNLAGVATSGSYNDLQDKPTIPAAQVQSDWNASSGMGEILNKPTLATVATSGSYNDLSNTPTIPTVPTNVSSFTNDAGYTTNTGTLTGVTFNGTSATVSSGVAAITATIPTVGAIAQNSTDAAQSGAVYTALAGKQDTISNLATITANAGKGVADVTASTGAVTITLANGDTYTVDLNHNHPAYLAIADIDDYVTAGTNVSISKDSTTGVLTISASGGGSGGVTDVTMNGSSVVSNGVAALGTVITSLSGCVQSNATTGITNIVVCADEAAYTAITTKDSNTLYLIKESNA